jgi:hypothetical protein
VDLGTQTLEVLNGQAAVLQDVAEGLSALIHNYDDVLTVIFFTTRTLRVEWIRSLIYFFRQDLQD